MFRDHFLSKSSWLALIAGTALIVGSTFAQAEGGGTSGGGDEIAATICLSRIDLGQERDFDAFWTAVKRCRVTERRIECMQKQVANSPLATDALLNAYAECPR